MMTLIAVAITTTYAYSAAVALGLQGEVFFRELTTLIDVMLLGHWIEMRSVMRASAALETFRATGDRLGYGVASGSDAPALRAPPSNAWASGR